MTTKHQARLALRARLRRSCPNLTDTSIEVLSDAQIEMIESCPDLTYEGKHDIYCTIIYNKGAWEGVRSWLLKSRLAHI